MSWHGKQAELAERLRGSPVLRRVSSLEPACEALSEMGNAGAVRAEEARSFFETWFVPHRVRQPDSETGRVTSYYEPVLDGALARSKNYPAPLFALPDDLVEIDETNRPEGFPSDVNAARHTKEGLVPYPDRRFLSDPENQTDLEPIVWLTDDVEAYFVHIQGSVRIRLAEGGSLRLGYAGKNGHPYRSAGKAMIEGGHVPAAGLTADAMKRWLRSNPGLAPDILAENPSYVFFRVIRGLPEQLGPIGAEGVPLTPGRSIAVDPRFTGYGLPVYVSARLPTGESMAAEPFDRLLIAQDTGSAIRGPARGDLFWGTGENAGIVAGRINHPADMFVLRPRAEPPAK